MTVWYKSAQNDCKFRLTKMVCYVTELLTMSDRETDRQTHLRL